MSIQSALPVIVGGVVVVVSSLYLCSAKSADSDAILNNMGEPGAPPSKKSKGKAAPRPSAPKPAAPKSTSAAPKPTPAVAADAKKKAKKAAADKSAAPKPKAAAAPAKPPVVEEPYDPEYPPAPAPVKAGSAPAPAAVAPSNKKKSKGGGGGAAPKPTSKPASAKPAPVAAEASVEAAAVLSKPAAVAKAAPQMPVGDGWESVTKKVKKPKAKAFEEAAALEPTRPAIPGATYAVPLAAAVDGAAAAVAVPVAPTTSEKSVLVDPRKVGVVIGPKGATLKRIEDVSGCRLDVQPAEDFAKTATVKVTGPDDASLQLAEKMITELCSKGYSAKVAGEANFVESVLEVPARAVPDLIGSGGCVVKALRDACGVHVNFPTMVQKSGEAEKPAKVVVAGPKEGVAAAKDAIKLILQQYYAPATHPGLTHAEFDVEEWQLARFCGRAGSNVRHIQGDSKARVYVPREWSLNKAVVVVGTPGQVAVARKHVVRILEGIAEEAKAKDTSEEAMAAAFRAGKAHDNDDDEPHEEWMDAYLYKR